MSDDATQPARRCPDRINLLLSETDPRRLTIDRARSGLVRAVGALGEAGQELSEAEAADAAGRDQRSVPADRITNADWAIRSVAKFSELIEQAETELAGLRTDADEVLRKFYPLTEQEGDA